MGRFVAVLALELEFLLGGMAGAQTTADDFVTRAKLKYDTEDTDGCIADCNKAIELSPEDTDAYCTRALARDRKGDLDGALADGNKAIELNPKDPAPYNSRGFARYCKRDSDGAMADYDKAIKLDPRNSNAYCFRGIAKETKRDMDGAMADYDKAIEVNPKDSVAYDIRGLAREAKRDLDGALADYDKAIELNPSCSAANRNRGHCHFVHGDYAAAAADYCTRLSLTADDDDSALWLYLARQKSGLDGSPELSDFLKKHVAMNEWPAGVFRLYLGSITPDDVVAAAIAADAKAAGKSLSLPGKGERKAYFHVGQWYLLHGEKEKGVEFLKKCLVKGVPEFISEAAHAELDRMGVK